MIPVYETVGLDTKFNKGKILKTPEGTIYEWDIFGTGKNVKQYRVIARKEYNGIVYTMEGKLVNPEKQEKKELTFMQKVKEGIFPSETPFCWSIEWKELPHKRVLMISPKDSLKDYLQSRGEINKHMYSQYKNFTISIDAYFTGIVKYTIKDCLYPDGRGLIELNDRYHDKSDADLKKIFPAYQKEFSSPKELRNFIDKSPEMKMFLDMKSGNPQIL